ncbi:MAG: ABC transporter permease subunit, partial [Anaerolineales bacterium]
MKADARTRPRRPPLLVVAAALVLLALPSVLTRDLVTALFFTFTFITLALNYDLLGGFLGYLNLGQGTFFGLGAYATFILTKELPGVTERLGAPAVA